MKPTDKQRLDWLEKMARRKDGVLLHAETKSTGRIGLSVEKRAIRKAIDQAMGLPDNG